MATPLGVSDNAAVVLPELNLLINNRWVDSTSGKTFAAPMAEDGRIESRPLTAPPARPDRSAF